jgi:hypothetical protein
VGVGVEGSRDVCVTQKFLDELGMHSLGEEEARTGVPEIVEGDPREPRLFEQGPPEAVDEVGAANWVLLWVEKTHSHLPFLSPCSHRARTAFVVRYIERFELANLGGLTSPLRTVLLTLKVSFSRSMSPHLRPRSSPRRLPMVMPST